MFAICEDNKIYCWGNNYYGNLGLGVLGLGVLNIRRVKIFEFSDGKGKWDFFTGKTNGKLIWKEIRFLFIAVYKEDKKTCPFSKLPRDIIKEISIQETNIHY